MIKNAPSGMGDSQYLAMPLKTDKAPKAESKIFEMIKQIVNPENDELKFDSSHEQESIWFTAVSQNKLYTIMKMLSDRPDLITVCNDRLQSALHIAVEKRFARIVQELVELGADIHQKDLKGESALMKANSREF